VRDFLEIKIKSFKDTLHIKLLNKFLLSYILIKHALLVALLYLSYIFFGL